MNVDDWKKRNLFSVLLMVMHSFKVGYYYINYLSKELNMSSKKFLEAITDLSYPKDTPFIYEKVIGTIEKWTDDILKGGEEVFMRKDIAMFILIQRNLFL